MNPTIRFARFRQTGFTLIELMVGMAIGLLATIIIMQVMSLFEAQRRTTTGSADAQTNGGIALYSIAREVQMAGYSLLPMTDSALECTTVNVNAGATGITGITPIAITNGVSSAGVSATDSITIRYGNSLMGGAVAQIGSMIDPIAGPAIVVSNLGCAVNDITLVNSGNTCNLSRASAVSLPGATPISITLQHSGGAAPKASLACLGAWNEVTFAVNPTTGNLDRTVRVNGISDGTTVANIVTGTTPSVVGVVNLQAQYGISATANSNQVTQWVNASGATWTAPTVANRNRIKAIRVAVVARNAKIEPLPAITTACSSLTAAAPTGLCAWAGTVASPAPTVDLSQGDANWARYRYRVFETIIPLRNVIWAKDTL